MRYILSSPRDSYAAGIPTITVQIYSVNPIIPLSNCVRSSLKDYKMLKDNAHLMNHVLNPLENEYKLRMM